MILGGKQKIKKIKTPKNKILVVFTVSMVGTKMHLIAKELNSKIFVHKS